ncbi:MAG: xanthine dehydrogenase accessory protein XdhC [Proteobacteria bacterium]|nr:xanthine dehydrogenase accessory protein XdhC [Pseudomonadota bacterium]
MDLDKKAAELKAARIPFCRATVVRAEGSAPRRAGAKMIVTADASFGTVGGGGVEHMAIEEARRAMRRRAPGVERYDLTEDGVQPCGGSVEIFFEPVSPPRRIVVFGAGHVAEKLCPMLAEAGFEVTLVDERAERLSVGAFKAVAQRVNMLPGDFLPTLDFADDLHIICVTHRHVHDESIARFCLGRPFKYLGVISSRSKWKLFCDRFRSEGFSEEQISRVTAPIGLDIGGETPFEIAVAIVAQLIQLQEKPDDFDEGRCHFEL